MFETRGPFIRDLRLRAGLSQAEVGRRLGVNDATIGHWEADRRGVGDRLGPLLDVLGATDDEKLRALSLPSDVAPDGVVSP